MCIIYIYNQLGRELSRAVKLLAFESANLCSQDAVDRSKKTGAWFWGPQEKRQRYVERKDRKRLLTEETLRGVLQCPDKRS